MPNQLVYGFCLISNLKPLDEYHFDFFIIFDLDNYNFVVIYRGWITSYDKDTLDAIPLFMCFLKQLHLFCCIGFLFLVGFSFCMKTGFGFLFVDFVV